MRLSPTPAAQPTALFPHRQHPAPRGFLLGRFSNAGRGRARPHPHATARIGKPSPKRPLTSLERSSRKQSFGRVWLAARRPIVLRMDGRRPGLATRGRPRARQPATMSLRRTAAAGFGWRRKGDGRHCIEEVEASSDTGGSASSTHSRRPQPTVAGAGEHMPQPPSGPPTALAELRDRAFRLSAAQAARTFVRVAPASSQGAPSSAENRITSRPDATSSWNAALAPMVSRRAAVCGSIRSTKKRASAAFCRSTRVPASGIVAEAAAMRTHIQPRRRARRGAGSPSRQRRPRAAAALARRSVAAFEAGQRVGDRRHERRAGGGSRRGEVGPDEGEEGHDRLAAVLPELAADEVERLHAVGALVDHARCGRRGRTAPCPTPRCSRGRRRPAAPAPRISKPLSVRKPSPPASAARRGRRPPPRRRRGRRRVDQRRGPERERAAALDEGLLVQQHPAHVGVDDDRVGRAVGVRRRAGRGPAAARGRRSRRAGRRPRPGRGPACRRRGARLVHHGEHRLEAAVRLAEQPAGGAVVVHHAGGVAVDAHLLLELADRDARCGRRGCRRR